MKLPIDGLLPEILKHFDTEANLVLQASPGSGKTTRVPPALLKHPTFAGKEIWVLEPRRLAAKWAARRVAQELGEEVGRTVGYQFRFESVGGRDTRLRFFTEGTLVRKLVADPRLARAGIVILDEFHERHLAGDLVLGYLRKLQAEGSPIRILAMSATLDSPRLAAHLGRDGKPAQLLELHAHAHPVELRYLDKPVGPRELAEAVRRGVSSLADAEGDILVFLPGQAEIRRAEEAVRGLGLPREILTLFGEMEREAQDRVMSGGGRPRVILSTNVAESSLTIDGVRNVIDSGLHKQATRSEWSGISALKLRPVSRASATQRAGRAGRQGPGRCLRLYTKHDHDTRAAFDPPELLRADLAQTMLELAALGIAHPRDFPWLDPPADTAVREATELLQSLGALAGGNELRLTPRGRELAAVSAHPRLARLVSEGAARGRLEEAACLAALLGEDELNEADGPDCEDTFDRRFRQPRGGPLARLEQQLRAQAPKPAGRGASWEDVSATVVLAGFPDRVANRAADGRLTLCTGGVIEGPPGAPGLVAVLAARETAGRARAGALWSVREDDLLSVDPSPLAEVVEWRWDRARGRIQKLVALRYFALALREETIESFTSDADREAAAEAFLRLALKLSAPEWAGLREAFRTSVPGGQEIEARLARLFNRVRLLEGAPALPGPARALAGITRLEHLSEIPWEERLLEGWDYEWRARLDAQCPLALKLKNGRSVAINYEADRPPWIESRLQDFFGERTTPRILGGKLPLLVHLLAPNHRPLQVTQDLEGFWARTYQEVRRELSRNYPRHPWPEDPLNAEPPPMKPPRARK